MAFIGPFRKPAVQLIKYENINPITDLGILVIPEAIFQALLKGVLSLPAYVHP